MRSNLYKSTLVSTPIDTQSLTSKQTCASGLVQKAEDDINMNNSDVVKGGYPIVDRAALKLAQFYAAAQGIGFSWTDAVNNLKIAYGFAVAEPSIQVGATIPSQVRAVLLRSLLTLSVEPHMTGRIVVHIENGTVKSIEPVTENEYVASLLTFLEIAEKAGFTVISPEATHE